MNALTLQLAALNQALATADAGDETLLNGRLGGALYHCYAYQAGGAPAHLAAAEAILAQALHDFNAGKHYQDMSYGAGAAGLFWLVAHMQQQQLSPGMTPEDWQFLNQRFFEQASRWIQSGRVDNLYGAIGLLHYLEQTTAVCDNRQHIDELVALLAGQAHWDEHGASFPNALLHRNPATIDLGVAHGLSGMALVLLNIQAKGFVSPHLQPLIEGLLTFVAGTYRPLDATNAASQQSGFPVSVVGAGRAGSFSNRLAWCYGDITQAIVFQKAGQLLDNPAWLALAAQVGASCAPRRTPEATLVHDAAFCHGAAGLAHLYQQLYQLTGTAAYQVLHQQWLAETVTRLEQELAAQQYRGKEWSLLEGLPGIGLVLLSATAPTVSMWSNLLFLS